jgi:hypothetical protein
VNPQIAAHLEFLDRYAARHEDAVKSREEWAARGLWRLDDPYMDSCRRQARHARDRIREIASAESAFDIR